MNALEGTAPALKGHFFSFAYWWQKDSGHFHPALMKDCWNGSACVPFTLPWFSFLWPFALFNKNGLGLHNRFPHNTEIHTTHNCALNQASPVFFSSLKSFSIRAILWSVTDESWKCSSLPQWTLIDTVYSSLTCIKSSVCKDRHLAILSLTPLKCIKVNNAGPWAKSLCLMRLSRVKKAMNMKCVMNKLCGCADPAKKDWLWN